MWPQGLSPNIGLTPWSRDRPLQHLKGDRDHRYHRSDRACDRASCSLQGPARVGNPLASVWSPEAEWLFLLSLVLASSGGGWAVCEGRVPRPRLALGSGAGPPGGSGQPAVLGRAPLTALSQKELGHYLLKSGQNTMGRSIAWIIEIRRARDTGHRHPVNCPLGPFLAQTHSLGRGRRGLRGQRLLWAGWPKRHAQRGPGQEKCHPQEAEGE